VKTRDLVLAGLACHPESAFFADDKVPGFFCQGKDLVLNQILPPVGRQNDIKSLSSRAKTRDLVLAGLACHPESAFFADEGSGLEPDSSSRWSSE